MTEENRSYITYLKAACIEGEGGYHDETEL